MQEKAKLHFMIADLREKVIDYAVELFSKKGYENVSVTDIAKKCKIATSTLYYHFKDKEDLLKQTFYDVTVKMTNHFRRGIDYSKPFEDQYKGGLYNAIKYLHKNKHRCDFYSIFSLSPGTPISVADRMALDDLCPIAQLLKKGLENGAFRKRNYLEAMTLGSIPIYNYSARNNASKYTPSDHEINGFISSLWNALQ